MSVKDSPFTPCLPSSERQQAQRVEGAPCFDDPGEVAWSNMCLNAIRQYLGVVPLLLRIALYCKTQCELDLLRLKCKPLRL
jgi:hypothetical protein